MKPKYDPTWTTKALQVPGNNPWWEKLEGEDKANAEEWVDATAGNFVNPEAETA